MKEIIERLSENFIFYSSIIRALKEEEAEILEAEGESVLIRHKKGYYYMLTARDLDTGKRLMNRIKTCDLLLVHEPFLIEEFRKQYSLYGEEICYQALYIPEHLKQSKSLTKQQWNDQLKQFYCSVSMEQRKEEVKKINNAYPIKGEAITIQALDFSYKEIILSHYEMLPEEIIEERLHEQMIYGGFYKGELVGFIGIHQEGSIGMLEIFPKYRRKGYATQMELFIIKDQLLKGQIPYAQIDRYNQQSMNLQKKLGMELSETTLCWLFQ